jgi:hypothetical protein
MSDARFFGVLMLLVVSAVVIGFVLGWAANPDDSHD